MENTVSTGTSDIDTSGGDCVPSDNFHSGTGKIREKITNREFNLNIQRPSVAIRMLHQLNLFQI